MESNEILPEAGQDDAQAENDMEDEQQDLSNEEHRSARCSKLKVAAFIISLISVAALLYQLNLLYQQNENASERLQMDKTPYAFVKLLWPQDTTGLPTHLKNPTEIGWQPDDTTKLKFTISHLVMNQGKERLILLASLGMRTDTYTEFFPALLSETLNAGNLNFPAEYDFLYRTTILPNDARTQKHSYYKVPPTEYCFFHTIYFYEDMMGNLFALDHCDMYEFGDPPPNPVQKMLGIRKFDMKDTFYELTQEERDAIVDVLLNTPVDNTDARKMAKRLSK